MGRKRKVPRLHRPAEWREWDSDSSFSDPEPRRELRHLPQDSIPVLHASDIPSSPNSTSADESVYYVPKNVQKEPNLVSENELQLSDVSFFEAERVHEHDEEPELEEEGQDYDNDDDDDDDDDDDNSLYENLLEQLAKKWLHIELSHNISKIASDLLWSTALNCFGPILPVSYTHLTLPTIYSV